jgi:anti-sigma B factor antagonist
VDDSTPPHASALSADLADDGLVPVIRLRGELDISSVELVRALVDEVRERHPERVIVDLGGLDFMDSSGLALLLKLAGQVGRLELRNPTPIIRRVVEMMGLSGTLLIEP